MNSTPTGPDEESRPQEDPQPSAWEPYPPAGPGALDFFGASAPATLPVPSSPAPTIAAPVSEAPISEAPVGQAPVGQAPVSEPLVRRGMRARTVVFGLVMLAISGSVLVATLTTIQVQAGVVTLAVLLGAGGVLFAGGLSAAVREMRHGGVRPSR
jgi:hypothetical protein